MHYRAESVKTTRVIFLPISHTSDLPLTFYSNNRLIIQYLWVSSLLLVVYQCRLKSLKVFFHLYITSILLSKVPCATFSKASPIESSNQGFFLRCYSLDPLKKEQRGNLQAFAVRLNCHAALYLLLHTTTTLLDYTVTRILENVKCKWHGGLNPDGRLFR